MGCYVDSWGKEKTMFYSVYLKDGESMSDDDWEILVTIAEKVAYSGVGNV